MLSTTRLSNNTENMVYSVFTEKLPLGELLLEAGLISRTQLQLALQDQKVSGYEQFKLGEILDVRGWVKQETSDFFASRWYQIVAASRMNFYRKKIGSYLKDAGLLNEKQIQTILEQQKNQYNYFGALAVIKGYIKQATLDFFVKNLFAENQLELQTESYLNRAQKYLKVGDFRGAILTLREAMKLNPNHCHCHAWLALVYLQQKQVSIAQVHLTKAKQINPADTFVKNVQQKLTQTTMAKPESANQSQGLRPNDNKLLQFLTVR